MNKELLKFLIKAEKMNKEAKKLNLYCYERDDKEAYMTIRKFLAHFDDYNIEKRNSKDNPYRAVVEIEDYKICALLDEKEYKKLQKELRDDN